jgi:hypothetical protein
VQRGVVNPESLSMGEDHFPSARITLSFGKKTRYELFAELIVIRSEFLARERAFALRTDCSPIVNREKRRFHLRPMVSSRRSLAADALHLSRAQGVLNLLQK